MIKIKICGITRIEDALAAADLGVDALGFIFYESSPRCVSPETARSIIESIPPDITKVGVFVNADIARIRKIVRECRLDMVQLHGDESPEYARSLPESKVIKAVDPRNDEDILKARVYPARFILVDSRDEARFGGTGRKADWQAAREIACVRDLILAGGLNSGNVHEALRQVNPAALDLNSGVELSPGIKDREKMREMVDFIRDADADNEYSRTTAFSTPQFSIFRNGKA